MYEQVEDILNYLNSTGVSYNTDDQVKKRFYPFFLKG